MTARVLIVDDHEVVRAGLIALLTSSTEKKIEIVGEAATGAQAVRQAQATRPDLVLMDISLPDIGGVEATRRIKRLSPDTRVLLVTIHDDRSLMKEAIKAGAAGYVLKQAIRSELLHAVNTVMRDQLYIDPVMAKMLLADTGPLIQTQPPKKDVQAIEDVLTPREVEVLELLAHGLTNRQVAEELHISIRTAEYHRANLMNKLGAQGRVDLVEYATDHGLI